MWRIIGSLLGIFLLWRLGKLLLSPSQRQQLHQMVVYLAIAIIVVVSLLLIFRIN